MNGYANSEPRKPDWLVTYERDNQIMNREQRRNSTRILKQVYQKSGFKAAPGSKTEYELAEEYIKNCNANAHAAGKDVSLDLDEFKKVLKRGHI